METSKTMVNVLIVTAILLIGVSVTSVLLKEQDKNNILANTTPKEIVQLPDTITTVSTTTESTTTEIVTNVSASTTTSTSTTLETKGFTGKKWTWVKTTTTNSSTTPKKATVFTVTLTATGTLSGTTDCNNFFGTYTSSSNTLTFGSIGATKMFCEESQENDFISALQKVTKYSMDKDNNLILSSGSGTMMFK